MFIGLLRSWFPQVFSIIDGQKVGVTIQIDDQLDHGPIIAQRECRSSHWDFLGDVYARLMDIEREWCCVPDAIGTGSYTAKSPAAGGNLA